MIVALSSEAAAAVNDELASGRFADPGAVLDAALKALRSGAANRREQFRKEVRIGLDELDAGLGVPFGDGLIDEILAEIECEEAKAGAHGE